MPAGPQVDVYVGSAKKHYLLLKLLLCYYSRFFDKCFNGPFIEGQTQKLDLPDDRVGFFEIMLECTLHGKVQDLKSFHKFNQLVTSFAD